MFSLLCIGLWTLIPPESELCPGTNSLLVDFLLPNLSSMPTLPLFLLNRHMPAGSQTVNLVSAALKATYSSVLSQCLAAARTVRIVVPSPYLSLGFYFSPNLYNYLLRCRPLATLLRHLGNNTGGADIFYSKNPVSPRPVVLKCQKYLHL